MAGRLGLRVGSQAGLRAVRVGPEAASAPPPAPPLPPPAPVIGFAINLHHTDHVDLYFKAIDQMAADGFNTIEVLTPAFQRDGAAEDIKVEVGPGQSPSREQIVTVLR